MVTEQKVQAVVQLLTNIEAAAGTSVATSNAGRLFASAAADNDTKTVAAKLKTEISALGATLVAAINATEEGRTKSGRRLHASSSGSAAARLGIPVGATAQKIVDSFAAFLTQPGTVAVMKQSGVLPNATRAPEGRAKLCHDANRTSMSAAAKNCTCDRKRPWPECSALMYIEGKKVFEADLAAPRNLTAVKRAARGLLDSLEFGDALERGAPHGPADGGGLGEEWWGPEGLASLRSLAAVQAGTKKKKRTGCKFSDLLGFFTERCGGISCKFPLPPPAGTFLTLQLLINGCTPTISVTGDTMELCGADVQEQAQCLTFKQSRTNFSMAVAVDDLATNSHFDVALNVCLKLGTFGKILKWVGLDGICSGPDATWWPLKSQVQFSIASTAIIASLGSNIKMQFHDNKDNTLCNFFRNSTNTKGWDWSLKCQDYCAWEAGSGHFTLEFGLNFLFWSQTWTQTIVESTVPQCDPAPLTCKAGQFTFNKTCTNCRRGTWTNNTMTYECFECPSGTYNPDEGSGSVTDCNPCSDGTYNARTGAGNIIACWPCRNATYNPYLGQAECKPCQAGTFARKRCTNCILSKWSKSQPEACANAWPGYFVNVTGTTVQRACPVGMEQPLEGQTNCTFCKPGTANAANGTANCPPCANGTYTAATGATACTPCAAGSFANVTGLTACIPCPVGTATNKTGRALCRPCPKGHIASKTGSTKCSKCKAGTYAPTTGKSTCWTCPRNSVAATDGAWECTKCPSDEFSQDSITCEACNTTARANWEYKKRTTKFMLRRSLLGSTRYCCPAGVNPNTDVSQCIKA